MIRWLILLTSLLMLSCTPSQVEKSPSTIIEIEEDKNKPSKKKTSDSDDKKGREKWQKPEQIIASMGDLAGLTIADLGAGSGYFSFRLVFEAEKVIALDIDPEMIAIMQSIKASLPENVQDRFEARLVGQKDAGLADSEVDMILIVNTIAYIEDRVNYLSKLKKSLKPGGRLLILDFKMQRLPLIDAPPKSERVYLDIIETELLEAGYQEVNTDDTSLDFQYIVNAHI